MVTREERMRQIETTAVELAEAEGVIVEAEQETRDVLATAAGDRAEGLIDAAEEAARRDAALAVLNSARERADGLRHALPELRQRLADEDQQRRRQDLDKLRATHQRAQQAQVNAAKAVAATLRAAAAAAREVQRHRDLVSAAEAELVALLTADDPPVARDDEPWNADPELLAFLAAGPQRPLADAERKRAETAAAQAAQDTEQLRWFAQRATETNLRQLPERLHAQAREILTVALAERAAATERQRAAAKGREAPRV